MVLEIPKTSQILRCCREIITLHLEIPKIKYSEHAYNNVLGTGNFLIISVILHIRQVYNM